MRILVDHEDVLSGVLRDDRYHVLTLWTCPEVIRPYVSADWKISEDPRQILYWLTTNPKGRAILIDVPSNATVQVPARCWRSRSPRNTLRILRDHK